VHVYASLSSSDVDSGYQWDVQSPDYWTLYLDPLKLEPFMRATSLG
jgi:hypothetical protein